MVSTVVAAGLNLQMNSTNKGQITINQTHYIIPKRIYIMYTSDKKTFIDCHLI